MKEDIVVEKFGLSSGDKIGVKVGSNILAGNDDGVNSENMKNIVDGIDYLMKIGLNVTLVSSGAVAVGKNIMEKKGIKFSGNLTEDEKAFLAQIGQIKLMSIYEKLFSEKEIIIGQVLLTHNNFEEKKSKKNLNKVFDLNVKNKVVAIINENDVISREELKFSDNDELAGLVAKNIGAKALILLSDIDGLKKNFGEENEEIIKEVNNIKEVRKYSVKVEGGVGKGQMDSKLNVMEKMMNNGIIGILANGGTKKIIEKIFSGKDCDKTIFRV